MSLFDDRADGPRLRGIESCEARLVLAHAIDVDHTPVSVAAHEVTGVSDLHQAWGLTGLGQTVVVIDSGIAYDHPALGGGFGAGHRVVGGWDFTEENDGDPYDDAPAGFHGTHVAGVIGSSDPQHLGVAPDVDLVGLRVFNDQGEGDFEWIERALQWVAENVNRFEHPITTVNLSLGTKWKGNEVPDWAMLEDELATLKDLGLFVTVAAGNDFQKQPGVGLNYPAASPYVVPVASHSVADSMSDFSRRSGRVLVAPGEQVTSTAPDFLYDFNGITDDYFTASGTSMAAPYVAASSVLVRQAMDRAGWDQVTGDQIYRLLRDTARQIYDAETDRFYHHIDVAAAVQMVLASAAEPPAGKPEPAIDPIDLGAVASIELTPGAKRTLYRLTASRTGILTAELLTPTRDATASVRVLDADRQPLQRGVVSSSFDRMDVRVRAGQTYFVESIAMAGAGRLQLTNLVTLRRSLLDVYGTDRDDTIRVQLDGRAALEVNKTRYELAGFGRSQIRINTGAGSDQLQVVTGPGDDAVWIKPHWLRATSTEWQIEASKFESAAVSSGGGHDVAHLIDSTADDRFVGRPQESVLQGDGFLNRVTGFRSVRGYASQGGTDFARLYDSPDDDRFYGLATYSVLEGPVSRVYVERFEQVNAYATGGGRDVARLYDSARDDVLYALPEYSVLEGVGFRNYAQGFSEVRSYATQGGFDQARLYGSAHDDRLTGVPEYAVLEGPGYRSYAAGFQQVRAYGHQGGVDTARLFGSPDDEAFYGLPEYSLLEGDGFEHYVAAFERVEVNAGRGGYDTAALYDSAGDDTFRVESGRGTLVGETFQLVAMQFDALATFAQRGGHDSAVIHGTFRDQILEDRLRVERFFGVCYPPSEDSVGETLSTAEDVDRVYQQARLASTLRVDAATVESLLQEIQRGDQVVATFGFLAVDYLLEDATQWL